MAAADREPIRLRHRVIYVSSQDDRLGEGVEVVNSALRSGQGWTSSKYCHFPQEILLRLHQNSSVQKIQLLCHHLFIPTKVDIYTGRATDDNPSWSRATFEKLGTVDFGDNTESGYKTRELKTVRVDSSGSFVKFNVYENHQNEHNPFSQVALMDITIFGWPIGPKHSDASDSETDAQSPASPFVLPPVRQPTIPPPSSPIAPPPGIPSQMSAAGSITANVEPPSQRHPADSNDADEPKIVHGVSYTQEIRTIWHMLDVKKKAAIRDENFEEAKRLKIATDKLLEAGERIDRLNSEKRAAVEEEDYDKAEHYKREMDAIRARTYEEIELLKLLTDKEKRDLGLEDSLRNLSRPSSRLKRSESAPANKRPNSNPRNNPYLDRDNMVLPAIVHQQQKMQQAKQMRRIDDNDSRLPPIDNGHTQPTNRYEEYPVADGPGNDSGDVGETDEHAIFRLHPKDVAQLTHAMDAFGAKMVRNCTSKRWQERQKGLEDLGTYLDQHQFLGRDDAYNILTPVLQLLQRALKDKIFNVYKAATNVLRFILVTFLPKHKIAKTGGALVAERTYYTLITRAGDTVSDPRFRPTSIEFAENAVMKADIQIAKAYAACFLRPFQASGHQKIDQAHAEIAERIVTADDASSLQLDLTEEKVCPFAVSCLQHTDATVRQTGTRILTYIYKMGNRDKVLRCLPRNNEATKRKWPLYKTIFDEFDRIDGKMGPHHVAPLAGKQQSLTQEPSETLLGKLKRENEELKRQLTEQHLLEADPGSTRPNTTSQYPLDRRRYSRDGYSEDSEPMCVFCGEVSRAFDDETLDMHYLKYCPMLTKCQLCKKVVEISALKDHYFFECTSNHHFRQCPRCKEPLLEEEYSRHQLHKRCQPAKSDEAVARCLLCHKDVTPDNDVGWRRHLVGATGCPGNPRKTLGVGAGKGHAGNRRNSAGAIDGKRKL